MIREDVAVVVGGGTMGLGIAYVLGTRGYVVEVVEPDVARQAEMLTRLGQLRTAAIERGSLDLESAARLESSISIVSDLDDVQAGPSVLIEAVPERRDLKQSVLARAERLEPGLLGTNTSSISIDSLADGLRHPQSLIGLHFFNPVWVSSLVEIVVGDRTAPDVESAARRLVDRIGKQAVVVRDRPGFATSRLGVLLGLEAIRMIEEGVADAAAIDLAMELGYRHPMGPLRLTDLVGLDVRLAIAENLESAYGSRFAPPDLLRSMVAEGRLGRKSGQGFYEWPESLA